MSVEPAPDANVPEEALSEASESDTQQATDTQKRAGESDQDHPARGTSSNATYNTKSDKSTDRARTGLKTTDEHASWREVYRACGVERWRP